MVLVSKWPFFELFFLSKIGQENVFYDILERIKAFLGYENKKLNKSKNSPFSKGVNPWFFSQNGHFSNLFFWGQNRPEKSLFYDILERIKAFLLYEYNKLINSKNWHLSKGVNQWFWYQNGLFSHFFFFKQNRPEKCFLRYSRTNKGLSRIWKKKVEKVEKLTFFQRG